MNYKVFSDAEEAIRFERRINRDCNERARTVAQVKEKFFSEVKPMHDQYIGPFKEKTDFVLLNSKNNGFDEECFNKILSSVSQKAGF